MRGDGELLVVRHAPPRPGAAGLCAGRHPVPVALSPGACAERIAAQLGRRRQPPPRSPRRHPHPDRHSPRRRLDRIWASPAPRCREPALRLGAALAVPVSIDPALWELDFGAWEGRPWVDLEKQEEFGRWSEDWRREAPPGGERVAALEARVARWWRRLAPGQRHLLVGHAGVIRALRVVARDLAWPAAMAGEVPYLVLEPFPLARSRAGGGPGRAPEAAPAGPGAVSDRG